MGIRTPVPANPAMTLGGLREGVTPLDMAHAFETFAAGGRRITGTLGAAENGPVGIHEVRMLGSKQVVDENRPERIPALRAVDAATATQIMATVVSQGTGRRAAFGEFAAGKTGTTENSGDAWFVGFTKRLTVAVWVGYPDKLRPMLTEFAGEPVEGGTFPALIWHDFMETADQILDERVAREREDKGLPPLEEEEEVGPAAPAQPVSPGTTVPEEGEPPVSGGAAAPEGSGSGGSGGSGSGGAGGSGGEGSGSDGGGGGSAPSPAPTPAPTPAPAPNPAPAPATPAAPEAGGTGAPPA